MSYTGCRTLEPIAREASIRRAAIIAGHYCVSEALSDLSNENVAEELSFESGASLLEALRGEGKDGVLVVWINDIGINKDARECLRAEYTLPDNYCAILERHGLDQGAVVTMFESAMRNKASTLLRKVAKRCPGRFHVVNAHDPDLVRCINKQMCDTGGPSGRIYAVRGPDREMLVVKEGPNPKCNLILGTFLKQVVHDFSPDVVVNIFNAIYSSRIRFGVYVSKYVLDNQTPIHTYFADESSVTKAYWKV